MMPCTGQPPPMPPHSPIIILPACSEAAYIAHSYSSYLVLFDIVLTLYFRGIKILFIILKELILFLMYPSDKIDERYMGYNISMI